MRRLLVVGSSIIIAIAFSAFADAEERSLGTGQALFSSVSCDPENCVLPGNSYKNKIEARLCCEETGFDPSQILKTRAQKLVDRETDDRDLLYIIDTRMSYRRIGADLERKVGNILEFSAAHPIGYFVSLHKNNGGWPLASSIKLTGHRRSSVCIISPLSNNRTGIEFAAKMMGNQNIPVVHEVNDFAIHFLAMMHESYHCIATNRSNQGRRGQTSSELIADLGAVNEALKLGMKRDPLIALADWRALRFAAAIANVVAGRSDGKVIYSKASPAHMTAVALNRLLVLRTPVTYRDIENLAFSSTVEGLYGQPKLAQKFLTRIFLLYKNTALKKRFKHASIQDADEILIAIGAPPALVDAVSRSVARYMSKLSCRSAFVPTRERINKTLVCRQSDDSYMFADRQLLGIRAAEKIRSVKRTFIKDAVILSLAEKEYLVGQPVYFPDHQQYHLAH